MLAQTLLPFLAVDPLNNFEMERRAPLVVPAVTKHTATAIFVHGLGDSGHGLLSMVESWRRVRGSTMSSSSSHMRLTFALPA
jgi:hypothetical protein